MDGKRIAVVTGGTRGMGKDISLRLAQDGDIVYAIFHSDEESAKATKKLLNETSQDSDVIKCNVAVEKEVQDLIEKIGEKHSKIDILVNNAGIFDFRFLEDMDEQYLDRVIGTNFKSQYFMMHAVIPYMKKAKHGRIINASSISGRFSDVGLVAYAASKAAVDMMTKIASAELAPYNITVNAYAPGIIQTDMTNEMIVERGETQVKQISMNRFGTGEDVAALVGFLASPQAGYITGEIIGVDGGFLKVQNPIRAYEYVNKKNK